MMKSLVVGICALLVSPLVASAQPAQGNPFADAAQYRQQRGPAPPATQRLLYEITRTAGSGAPQISQMVIDVAPDWSLVTIDGQRSVRDFKLNRLFVLHEDRFESLNGNAVLMTRVLERQNRTVLAQIVGVADAQAGKDCDADAELAVVVTRPVTPIALAERGAVVDLVCDGRTVSAYTRGSGAASPAALWPTLNAVAPMHPALFRRLRATGVAPARIDNTPRGTAVGAELRTSFRLVRLEPVNTEYPLPAGLPNATAALIDAKLGAGMGALAADAVASRALGGAPTADRWAGDLRTVFQKEGGAGVGMLLLPTANMFPKSFEGCQRGATTPFCQAAAIGQIALEQEPAPRAMLAIALADSSGNPNSTTAGSAEQVISAMRVARETPQRNHPALGAAYALVAMKFDRAAADQAKSAGLPTDFGVLQTAAVKALPYNPAYWLDVGDRFAASYDISTAMLLYETALTLPMPEAIAGNLAVAGKKDFFERVRNGFPDASLPTRP